MLRRNTRQAHIVFDQSQVVRTPPSECRSKLMLKSVRPKTLKQYDSRLTVLAEFLETMRGEEDVDPTTCTEDEFVQFLYNNDRQLRGSAEGVRSALILYHRAAGVDSFLEKKGTTKLVRAADKSGTKFQKGVLSAEQIGQVDLLIRSMWGGMELTCNSCKGRVCTEALCGALHLMLCSQLRPGNLKDVKVEHVGSAPGASMLWVQNMKTAAKGETGGEILLSDEAADILRGLVGTAVNGYYFPRCVSKHLDAALRKAELLYDWTAGLVFSPHCLRHTMMTAKKRAVEDAVIGVMCGVSGAVFRQTYTKARKMS